MIHPSSTTWSTATWIAVLAIPAALFALALRVAYMNHDAAWYLHMAAVWLDGATLYHDIVDTNPPLIVFLSTPPVLLSRALDVAAPAVFQAWVFGLATVSIAFCAAPVRRHWQDEPSRAVFTAALVACFLPLAGSEFGQREHFAAILTAPFVLHSAEWGSRQFERLPASMTSGAMAGLGFALKPHFLVAWLAIEITLRVRHPGAGTWRRPAVLAAAITIILYVLVIVALFPEYGPVAREVMEVYGGLNQPWTALLRLGDLRVWAAAAVVCAVLLRRLPTIAFVLFAAASGFLAAALVQMKGWGYHFYPFRVFIVLFFAAVGIAMMSMAGSNRRVARLRQFAAVAAIVLVLAWSTRVYVRAQRAADTGYVADLIHLIDRHGPPESLALLSMRFLLFPAFPAVNYTRADWVLRHNSLWFLPGLYEGELENGHGYAPFRSLSGMPFLERKYFEEVVTDLCARPPRLLLVDTPATGEPPPRGSVDLMGYYGQDPRVARLMTGYRPVERVGPFAAFVRQHDHACPTP